MSDLYSNAVIGCGGEINQSGRGVQDTNELCKIA